MAQHPNPLPRIRELGFGKAADAGKGRLLNRDGSFNSQRRGLPYRNSLSLYFLLVTMSWPKFFLTVTTFYFLTNLLFAELFLLCGPNALEIPPGYSLGRFASAFFFSVQTIATIGYGHVSPSGLLANCLVTVEALIGLLGFSLVTGFLFARISRPTSRILFSDSAIVAPHEGKNALMFRLTNARQSQLIEVEARVILTRIEGEPPNRKREFHPLELEYPKIAFLTMHWTVVHLIDEKSPLWGVSEAEFIASDPEFLILLSGLDDIFVQAVHARSSYKGHEVVWGAKFTNIYANAQRPGETIAIEVDRLSEIERAPLS